MKISGFDELQKELSKIEKNAKELEKTESVSFDELFTTPFMKKYTNFNSIDELFEAGDFKVETEEDFEAIPENELNQHISKSTKFNDWEEMIGTAGQDFGYKKLGF